MMRDNYFIAIPLPDSVKSFLATQQKYFANISGVRCVQPRYLHMTLHFFHDFDPKTQFDAVAQVLDSIAAKHDPFALKLSDLDMFLVGTSPRVVWCGVSGEIDAMHTLQSELTRSLRAMGHHTDNRPFVAHITLARIGFSRDTQKIIQQVQQPVRPLPFFASSMCLYQSTVSGGKRVYLPLHKSTFSTARTKTVLGSATSSMQQDMR